MTVALPVVVFHEDQGAVRGQVPAGQVLAAQKLQIMLREAVPDELSPPELYHLRRANQSVRTH
jgi:hypothetical protein